MRDPYSKRLLPVTIAGDYNFCDRRSMWMHNRSELASVASGHNYSNLVDTPAVTARPIYERGCLRVTKSNTSALYGTGFNLASLYGQPTTSFFIFAVIKLDAMPAGSDAICGWTNSASTNSLCGLYVGSAGNLQLGRRSDSETGVPPSWVTSEVTNLTPASKWVVVGAGMDGQGNQKFIDHLGVIKNESVADARGTTTLDRFNIGALAGISYSDARISRVLVLDTKDVPTTKMLTDDQIYDLHEYLDLWQRKSISEKMPSRMTLPDFGAVEFNDDGTPFDAEPAATHIGHWMTRVGGRMAIEYGHWHFGSQCNIGSPTDHTLSNGGIIEGDGAGLEPSGSFSGRDQAGQSVVRWIGNDNEGALFNLHTYGTVVQHVCLECPGTTANEVQALIALEGVPNAAVGKSRMHNITFSKVLSQHTARAIMARGTGHNEDECKLSSLIFRNIDYPLELNHANNVGWFCDHWKCDNPTQVVRVNAGGKVYLGGGIWSQGGALLALRGNNEQTPRNTSQFSIRDWSTDGGLNTTDAVFVTNTDPGSGTKTYTGSILIEQMTAQHENQSIPLIDMEDFNGMIIINGGYPMPDKMTGPFAHMTGQSATNRAMIAMGNMMRATFDAGDLFDGTSEYADSELLVLPETSKVIDREPYSKVAF